MKPIVKARMASTGAKGLEGIDGREVETGSKQDPEWAYYRDFLLREAPRR